MKIGINDFGIGGLGLYKLLRVQTTADLVYFSDSGYHPYGTLSRTELQDRLQKVIDFFHSQDVQHIAVACHAASTGRPAAPGPCCGPVFRRRGMDRSSNRGVCF